MKSFKFIILLLFLSECSFGQDIDNTWYQKSNKVQETIMSKCSSGSYSQKNRKFCYGEWKNLEGTTGIQFKVKGPMISSDQLDGNRQSPPKGVVFYEAHLVFRNIGNQFISFKFSPKRCDYLKLHNDDYYGFWVGLLPGGYSQEIDVDLECTNTTLEYVVSEIIHCDQIKYKNTDKESVTYYVKNTCYDPTENMNIKNQVIRKNGKQFQKNETATQKNNQKLSENQLINLLIENLKRNCTFSCPDPFRNGKDVIFTLEDIEYSTGKIIFVQKKNMQANGSTIIKNTISIGNFQNYYFDERMKHYYELIVKSININNKEVLSTTIESRYADGSIYNDPFDNTTFNFSNITFKFDESQKKEFEEIVEKLKTGDFKETNSVSKENYINKQEKINFEGKQSKKDNSNKNENYSYENAKKISDEYNNYISQYNNDKDATILEINLRKLVVEHPEIFDLDKQFYITYSSVLTSNASKLYDEGKFNDAEKKIRESLKYDSDNITTNQYLFNILIFKYNDKKIKNVKDIIKELNILIDKLSLLDKENISQYLEIKNKINK